MSIQSEAADPTGFQAGAGGWGEVAPKGRALTYYSVKISRKLHANEEKWTVGASPKFAYVSKSANEVCCLFVDRLEARYHRDIPRSLGAGRCHPDGSRVLLLSGLVSGAD